ncbi:cofilin [Aspergillus karnatakaensis]|uniref:actin-binding ADF family protein n=1 Tax=Aspergillus karnatakaensis TaxID=1810916 RepID=UPI003CCD63B5
MASGVTVHSVCIEKFQGLKLRQDPRYIIYGLSKDLTEIVVHKTSSSSEYEDFCTDLPEYQCAWAVYDLKYEDDAGNSRQKLVFFSWSPDDARIKEKMIFASSRDALRRALVGVQFEIYASERSEVAYDAVIDKARHLR